MTAGEHPEHGTTEQPSAGVRDVLFAADLKRLVRASRDNEDDIVSELREHYIPE
ncbi:hypothetical protein FHX37_2172 [Haloactinospora alba]|uniref:Uncharacterized protein n=1 Tax=Haloactinospora alba TaxID=405555 RepID=A0A543NK84_9ACTN|nr:hypothetical protein [Haloactinospora alba]TQN32222.1 hypothetical protein FHX37_2172 [Haloactinospora alba]